MSEFDDTDLARRLRAAAGTDPDLAAAHSMLGRRVARARRRRAVLTTGVATVSMLMMGTVYAWQATDDNGRITAADSSAATIDAEPADDATAPAPATTSAPVTTMPTPTDATTSPSGPASSQNSQTSGEDRSAEESLPAGTTSVRTIGGIGGSITVRLAAASDPSGASAIRLTASEPTGGFVARTTTSRPAEVAVDLTSDTHRTRIRVRLDGSRLRIDVDESRRDPASGTGNEVTLPSGSTPGVTAPGATAPGRSNPGATAPGATTPSNPGPGNPGPSNPGPNNPGPSTTDSDDSSDDRNDDDSDDDNSGSGNSGSGSRDERVDDKAGSGDDD